MNRARLLNLAGIAIGVAGVAFVTVRIIRDREAIAEAFESVAPGWLVLGVISGWTAMALIGLAWMWVMRADGQRLDTRRGLAWFFVGQLGKYVPGGIWPIVGQAELAHRGGVPRRGAYSSTAWSMIGTFGGAAAVGSVTGLALEGTARWASLAIAVGLLLTAGLVTVPTIRRAGERAASRLLRRDLGLPSAAWLGQLLVRHVPVWIFFSGMNIFAVVALGVDLDARLAVQLIAATCLSWMAGFVIIGLPGGLGVRETVFVSITTAPLGSTVALSAAVISRVVSIVVDLSAAGVSTLVARRAAGATADSAGDSTADADGGAAREGTDGDGYAAP